MTEEFGVLAKTGNGDMMKSLCAAAVFGLVLTAGALPGAAATISFDQANTTPYLEDGFQVDDARLNNGNCLAGSCMGLNTNETSILTRTGGGAFSVSSIWFDLVSRPAGLTVTSFNGATQIESIILTATDGPVFSHLFTNITSLVFHNSGTGNVRVDDIVVSAVPIPATLPLFGAALAGLAVMRRRRSAQA